MGREIMRPAAVVTKVDFVNMVDQLGQDQLSI